MSKDGMTVAVVVLAASTARWRFKSNGWNGELERSLAMQAVHSDAAFKRAAARAAKIVAEHWPEIAAES